MKLRISAALAIILALVAPAWASDSITTPGGSTYPLLAPGGFVPLQGVMLVGPGSSASAPLSVAPGAGATWVLGGTLPAFASTPTVNAAQSGSWTITSNDGGAAATGVTMPTGGSGLTGWLSGVYSKLSSILTNLGSPFQAGANIGNTAFGATESGTWQVTPTLTTVSTLSLTSTTTAYTTGQIVANNGTAGSITNPSFSMPSAGGAIPRLRLQTTDTLSTAWASASVQVDLWSAAPTWTNGDHATWLPATGSASHIASFSCTFPSAVWGDGLATECTPIQGNYVSTTATTIYWSVQATSGSGVLTASKAMKLIAELN